jgi:Zn-dependent M16 (insulinase) family peptidase
MDLNLFAKHIKQINKNKTEKEKILNYIQKKTGVILEESNITIKQKKITLNTSSVIYSKLIQKNIQGLLEEIGFVLN